MKLELSAYRPSGNRRAGVLAVDLEIGVAVFVGSERTHQANQALAESRLKLLLEAIRAIDPGLASAEFAEGGGAS